MNACMATRIGASGDIAACRSNYPVVERFLRNCIAKK